MRPCEPRDRSPFAMIAPVTFLAVRSSMSLVVSRRAEMGGKSSLTFRPGRRGCGRTVSDVLPTDRDRPLADANNRCPISTGLSPSLDNAPQPSRLATAANVGYAPRSPGRDTRPFGPSPLLVAGTSCNTPKLAECLPAVTKSMPSAASPRLRSSRIAAARLGMR
jgi:hypothetical protein